MDRPVREKKRPDHYDPAKETAKPQWKKPKKKKEKPKHIIFVSATRMSRSLKFSSLKPPFCLK
jgi:hypothetical protein